MIILVIISYVLLAVYEFIPLYKQKLWKDFWTNAALWTLSFSIAAMISLGIDIPSPAKPIKKVIESIIGVFV
jgi:hypothetical protein